MSQPEVLIVEDEGIIAADIQDSLQRLGYQVIGTAASSEEALQKVAEQRPDVVLMDIQLKGDLDGIDTAALLRQRFDVPAIFVTAYVDDELLERAKATEPYGYIVKPIGESDLHPVLQIAFHKHRMERERAKLLLAEQERAERILSGSLKALMEILGTVSPQALDLGQRLKTYMATLAGHLQIEGTWELEQAALLSQIGYVSVPATVIQKLRAGLTLSSAEREMVTRVPELGRNLLARISHLELVADVIYYQAKNFDGTGFPRDERGGQNIPHGARMLRILKDLREIEAAGMPRAKIPEQMKANAGWYDPCILAAVIGCLIDAPPVGSTAVKLVDLRVGQTLLAPIETLDGTVLVGTGNKISPNLLHKLTNFAQQNTIKEPIFVEAQSLTD